MRRVSRWLTICVLVVVVGASPAAAQAIGPGFDSGAEWYQSFRDPSSKAFRNTFGPGATRAAASAYDAAATGTTGQTIVSMGKKFLRSPVTKFAGAALISGALFWFFEEAQKATGTDLDSWWDAQDAPSPFVWSEVTGWETTVLLNMADLKAAGWSIPYGANYADSNPEGWGNGIGACYARVYGATTTYYSFYTGQMAGLGTGDAARAYCKALVEDWLLQFAPAGYGGESVFLVDLMDSDPAAEAALEDQVIGEYLADRVNDWAGYPQSFSAPFGQANGEDLISLDPAIENYNVWTDNAFYDPTLDTDGDGYTDSREVTAGTDPDDASSVPDADPYSDPGLADSDGDGVPDDYDGDGIPDGMDPCPYSVMNECGAAETADEAGFDGECGSLACESTQQSVASSLDAIENNLNADLSGIDAVYGPEQVFADPDLTGVESWQGDTGPLSPARQAFESSIVGIEQHLDTVWAAAEGTFPFGMGSILTPPATAPGSNCPVLQVNVPIGGTVVEEGYDICTNPLDDFMVNTVRPLLAVLLSFGCVWLIMQWVREA